MRHYIILIYAWTLELLRKVLLLSDTTINLIYIPGINRLRHFNAKARTYAEFIKARKNVPAYSEFLKSVHFKKPSFSGMVPDIHEIPFTDKENYVKQYSMEARCVNGNLPGKEIIIDESSGSSGTAINWARGKKERLKNARIIKFAMLKTFGKGPLFIINAFAMGPWATGVNVTMSCVKFSRLKTLGPDKIKIENTLKHFGKGQQYIIMGYPPFLKLLTDSSDISWNEFNVSFVFGGESMTEGMRDYLMSKGIKRIYSSLGASDLELNLGAENDFTISLRKLLRSNAALKERIIKYPGALPMIFQFNPTDFYIESSEKGELIITVCRTGYISPKIRYNIHDRGHILQMKELNSILKELNIGENDLQKPKIDLPLLLHYGRCDMTVSFFGANIGPVDIHEVIYSLPILTEIVNSFCINMNEDEDGNKQLIVSLELNKEKNQPLNCEELQKAFFEELAKTNQDFREAKKMLPNNRQTVIWFYKLGTGPFENSDLRIKAKYVRS